MHMRLAAAMPRRKNDLEALCNPSDERSITGALINEDLAAAEHFANDTYLDEIIPKPWGYEYRVYADLLYDVWKLSIDVGERTSMHCHPNKETALLCLSGHGRVHRLDLCYSISAGDIVTLPKSAFHATENNGDESLNLIEVETPRNKLDLKRVGDKYGRMGRRYETRAVKKEIAPLKPIDNAIGAKLRPLALHQAYKFSVMTIERINCEAGRDIAFAVSLARAQAFRHEIKVLTSAEMVDVRGDPSEFYLLIQRRSSL